MVRGLLVAACCILLASCGAARKSSALPASAAPETTTGAQSPMPGNPHDEINQLEEKITIDRAELKLEEPTPQMISGASADPMGATPALQDPKCRPAQNETCKTSCTLSDSICGNANRICEIAKSLTGDNWAMGRCAKANTTCEQSRTKCCGCQ
jgi:hypothetical protein